MLTQSIALFHIKFKISCDILSYLLKKSKSFQKNNMRLKKSPKISTPSSTRSTKTSRSYSSRLLLSKAQDILMHNVQISKLLLIHLSELTWDVNPPLSKNISIHTCPICAYNYNNHSHVPICLPCGHSLCRKCIFALQTSVVTGQCPFDRKEFYIISELLPINRSLLPLDSATCSRTCALHGMELIGYCKDDSQFICGKCIFTHKTHNFDNLEEVDLSTIVNEKIENIKHVEDEMNKLLGIWESYKEFIIKANTRLNETVRPDKVKGLGNEDLGLITTVQDYFNKILKDLEQDDEESASIWKVVAIIKENVEFRQSFEEMDMKGKLSLNELTDSFRMLKLKSLVQELDKIPI
jgi:hypothetical protein